MRVRPDEEPRIGIFWGLLMGEATEIVSFSKPVSEVSTEGGFKTLPNGHIDLWRKVQRRRPDLRGTDYEYFPRGRVNFDVENGVYLLLADRRLLTSSTIARLMQRFRLDGARTQILSDPHYR